MPPLEPVRTITVRSIVVEPPRAQTVDLEVAFYRRLPFLVLIGCPQDVRLEVVAAIRASGISLTHRVVVAPSSPVSSGIAWSHFGMPIALALRCFNDDRELEMVAPAVGALAPDGSLVPRTGYGVAAAMNAQGPVFVHRDTLTAAARYGGAHGFGVEDLQSVATAPRFAPTEAPLNPIRCGSQASAQQLSMGRAAQPTEAQLRRQLMAWLCAERDRVELRPPRMVTADEDHEPVDLELAHGAVLFATRWHAWLPEQRQRAVDAHHRGDLYLVIERDPGSDSLLPPGTRLV